MLPGSALVLDYVNAAARLAGVPLTPELAGAVAVHFERSMAIAKILVDTELATDVELAEVFRPAPFPEEDPR